MVRSTLFAIPAHLRVQVGGTDFNGQLSSVSAESDSAIHKLQKCFENWGAEVQAIMAFLEATLANVDFEELDAELLACSQWWELDERSQDNTVDDRVVGSMSHGRNRGHHEAVHHISDLSWEAVKLAESVLGADCEV